MGGSDERVVLVIVVDLIAIKDCCVPCVGKFGCAQKGRFCDARGDVDVSCRCLHVSCELTNFSGFLCDPIGQAENLV